MPWQFPVLLRVLTAYVLLPYAVKGMVGKHSRIKRLTLSFAFSASLAVLAALAGGADINPNTTKLQVFALGFVVPLSTYAQWRSMEISLSKNAIFTFWDDLISMALCVAFLGEGTVLRGRLLLGITTSILALLFFARDSWVNRLNSNETTVPRIFYAWVMLYSTNSALSYFLQRYWASTTELERLAFCVYWYLGTVCGASLFWFMQYNKEDSGGTSLSPRDIIQTGWLALWMTSSMGLSFWSYQLAPQVVTQSIYMVAEMILPALLGLVVFGERKQFNRAQTSYFALGFIGALLVITGF